MIVNYYILDDLTSSLYWEGDEELPELSGVDEQNDEAVIKAMIRQYAIPHFVSDQIGQPVDWWKPCPDVDIHANFERKDIYRLNLRYFLTTDKADFSSLLQTYLAFDPEGYERQVFLWYWELWFPGEDFTLVNFDGIKERNLPAWYDWDKALKEIKELPHSI